MKKILPIALHAACSAILSVFALAAEAQSPSPGRTAFDESGCRSCHAYSSRRGAPSVRDMLATLEGEPEKALKGIDDSEAHGPEIIAKSVSKDDLRLMAEWLSGTRLADPAVVAAEPTPAPPAQPQPVVAPQRLEIAPAALAPIPVAAAASPVIGEAQSLPASARVAVGSKVTAIVLESGKNSDQLLISMSGRQPEGLDIQTSDGNLIIRLPGLTLASDVPATLTTPKSARAVGSVQSAAHEDTLILTVVPRSGDLKYNAIQGRNRLSIELTSVPSKRKSDGLTAVMPAASPTASATVSPKREVKSTAEKASAASKPVAEKQISAPKAEVAARNAKEDEAKAKLAAKAKSDADAKAKQEADALAQTKKEAEAKAKRESDALAAQNSAKRESDNRALSSVGGDAAKKELEMLAALKASAEALQGGGSGKGSDAKAGRRDRSKLKAPEKFRDEPCPPLAESDPIGNVDEARAKDIIERVGCPQCHAFVQKKTGPPFKRVFEKMKGNPSCVIRNLKKNKEHNEEGVTDDLKGPEFKVVADYIASRAK